MSVSAFDPALRARIRESESYCKDVTRRASSSFGLPFLVLPKRKRLGFEVIYAFMRLTDDLSDDENHSTRSERMAAWRDSMHRVLDGGEADHPAMPALLRVVHEFDIPVRYLDALIDGTMMDLTINRYRSFDDLYRYCYHVAGVVGLVSLRLFGLHDPTPANQEIADKMAEACGIAFQITNILRDIKEDAERDRIYVPTEDLERFSLTEADIKAGVTDDRFRAFMRFEVERAEHYYDASSNLADMIAADARPCFRTMRGVYHGILEKIVSNGYDVYTERARVPLARKLGIAAKAFFLRTGP